jgi:hypothetical protein
MNAEYYKSNGNKGNKQHSYQFMEGGAQTGERVYFYFSRESAYEKYMIHVWHY